MALPFALLGHPAGLGHLEGVVGRKLPPRPLLLKMLEWAPPFVMAEFDLRSPVAQARGLYITCPFLPETLREQPFGCLAKVMAACRLAEERGARLACLGGFTSIAARRGSRRLCLPYTTGSRLTAMLATSATLEAASLMGIDLGGASVAIIGGLGEIGRECALALAGRVGRLILTTRRADRRRLPAGLHAAELSADNELACAQADVIIAAAASPQPLVDTRILRPGSLVCDVGYPANVRDRGRTDALIFRGGLSRPPHPLDFGFDLGLPGPALTYGCFTQAMLLALEGELDGDLKGEAELTQAELAAALPRHGFQPSGFWRGARELTPEDFTLAAVARSTATGGARWV